MKESKDDWIEDKCPACNGTGSAVVARPVRAGFPAEDKSAVVLGMRRHWAKEKGRQLRRPFCFYSRLRIGGVGFSVGCPKRASIHFTKPPAAVTSFWMARSQAHPAAVNMVSASSRAGDGGSNLGSL
jgi:hypothetical protein